MGTALFTGSSRKSFLIFCQVSWSRTRAGWRYINLCLSPVCAACVDDAARSKVRELPGPGPRLQSPADASNFDAGPKQIRISTSSISGVPAGQPLWQCLLPVCLTPMVPGFISLRFLTPGSSVHLMICFIFELRLQPGTELWKTLFTLKTIYFK